MDWAAIGMRIRKQREFLGLTRERLAELLEVTPKFCSDIELGHKGMSVATLCRLAEVLRLSTDYILFGAHTANNLEEITQMLAQCPPDKLPHVTTVVKNMLLAIDPGRR